MGAAFTLDQAAERAGVSRWTVARALKAGRLRGFRDNRGRWRVDPEALDAWAAEQGTVPHMVQAIATAEQPGAVVQTLGPDLATEFAVLRVRLEGAEARAAELERDRDHWRELAGRLSVYQAKAARLGLAEDSDLLASGRIAAGLLSRTPCDLQAVTRAITAFQNLMAQKQGATK